MKVAELEGVMLDMWVAKANGFPVTWDENDPFPFAELRAVTVEIETGKERPSQNAPVPISPHGWHPSTSWQQGGPLIDRECISVKYEWNPVTGENRWHAHGPLWSAGQYGKTALEAAMRYYVAHKFSGMPLEE